MNKNIFGLTFLILGTVIGAGFASGKEIVTFFTRFGHFSFLLILISGIVIYFSFYLYLKSGHIIHPNNFTDVTNSIIKNKTKNFYNIIILASFILVTSGMFAGVREISFFIENKTLQNLLMGITIILCFLVCRGGDKNLSKVNSLTMPVVATLIIVVCVLTNFLVKRDMLVLETSIVTTALSVGSCLIYVGLNIILAGCMLLQIGKKYSTYEIKKASFYAAFIITLILLLINATILFSDISLLNAELPILSLSYDINNFWGVITIIIIWFCIFTALTSSIFVIAKFLNKYFKNFALCNVITIIITFLISMFGFTNIVTYVYPVIGIVGVFYTIKLYRFYLKNTRTNNVVEKNHMQKNSRFKAIIKRLHRCNNNFKK